MLLKSFNCFRITQHFSTTIIIFLLIFCVINQSPFVTAVRLGAQVLESGKSTESLIDKMASLRVSLKEATKNKQIKKFTQELDATVSEYILSNTCFRYYLHEYLDFHEFEFSETSSTNMISALIALDIQLFTEPDNKVQQLNLNILDREFNMLRRKNRLLEKDLHMVIDYPIYNSLERFNKEYIDICFENIKVDKSWSSQPRVIDAYMTLEFGMPQIVKIYKKHSKDLSESGKKLENLEREIDLISHQLSDNIANSESKLRNTNEDTNLKVLIMSVCFVSFLTISCLAQLVWLIRYLKSRGFV